MWAAAIAVCLVLVAEPKPTPPCDILLVEKNTRLLAENERLYQENLKLALTNGALEREVNVGINEGAKYRTGILIVFVLVVAAMLIQVVAALIQLIVRLIRWLWSLRGRHRKK